MKKRWWGWAAFAAYIGTIFAANWAITRFGFVPVGFGLLAPAGVYFVGLAFTLRDITQDGLGRWWTVTAILLGAGASYFVAGSALATASAVAFLLSELCDFAIYTPLRERGLTRAVLASNIVGLVVDSAVFLWLAFGSLEFITGQIVGKTWVTLLALPFIYGWRRIAPARHHVAA